VTSVEAVRGDRPEAALVSSARAGGEDAFSALFERHRRELHVHAYRLLGSIYDAEDAVQETFLRAWRGVAGFEGRASFRSWLYRIATNICLDALDRRPRRILPSSVVPAADPEVPAQPPADLPWLTPYPDVLLDELESDAAKPDDVVVARETIELAFLAAIQHLPPRQRAALILRDVLGWSAKETAALLDCSVAGANSAVQRARTTLKGQVLTDRVERPAATGEERSLLRSYVDAWHRADVPTLVELLTEDARMTMPPVPSWYDGRDAVAAFMRRFVFSPDGPPGMRLLLTRANRHPAFAVYQREGETLRPLALKVLTLRGGGVSEITGFVDPRLFPLFGLPETLER
jgi:RNA polymerase sigma-70 factor (ECF subfamily)